MHMSTKAPVPLFTRPCQKGLVLTTRLAKTAALARGYEHAINQSVFAGRDEVIMRRFQPYTTSLGGDSIRDSSGGRAYDLGSPVEEYWDVNDAMEIGIWPAR